MNPLIEAYTNTDYLVNGTNICINIGKQSEELHQLLSSSNHVHWAFITAYNPFSISLEVSENTQRHQNLKSALAQYDLYEGEGRGQDENWPPERSLLVLGIYKSEAEAIGCLFGQNAIVYGESGKNAELLILRNLDTE